MSHRRLHLCLARMGGSEQRYIKEAFDSNWVVPLGPNVDAFEKSLEEYLGSDKHVVALSSGTAALHLAMVMLGIGKGDEVLCQSFTFAASANPIVYCGATPVFVDSEALSWNMSPFILEDAIKERIAITGKAPKAIVVVHLYGMPAMMDLIMDVAHRYGIPVIEDAAEALGSSYNGHKCGTMGDFGVLSFNGNKMITTSGGGALVCPSAEAKRTAAFYATQAKEPLPYYHHEKIGYNYRLSNICAGIGLGQMEVLDDHLAHHYALSVAYYEALADVPGVMVQRSPSVMQRSNYWLTTVLFDGGLSMVEKVRNTLEENNVESRRLWKPMHLQPVFADAPAYIDGTSEWIFERGLCLPSGPDISKSEDVPYIVNIIKRCVAE